MNGAAMEPSLVNGDLVTVYRVNSLGIPRPLERGDIVAFKAPTQPDKEFIKRLIGLPGDSVLIKNGTVLVNGQPLSEPYVRYPAAYTFPFDGQARRVPDDNYFVLGDNRPNSADSHLGWFVPQDNVIGVAVYLFKATAR